MTAAATPACVTQVEFAAIIGCHKSHVTRLKQHGRLVLDEETGLVDVVASKLRITETEGGRDDVAARHAAEKGLQAKKPDESRVSAQTRKEMAQADVAEMERDVMRGKLIERELVEAALNDVVVVARQAFENFPHRVASKLVGKDFEEVIAILKHEVQAQIGDTHGEARRQLAELTKVAE